MCGKHTPIIGTILRMFIYLFIYNKVVYLK